MVEVKQDKKQKKCRRRRARLAVYNSIRTFIRNAFRPFQSFSGTF